MEKAIERFDEYDVLSSLNTKSEILEACQYHNPDILVVSENLAGRESLMQICLEIVKLNKIRIVYIAPYLDMSNETRVRALGVLAMAGVYDILHEKKLNTDMIRNLLNHPKTFEDVEYLTRKIKSDTSKANDLINFDTPDEEKIKELESDIYKNLFVFSSIKPGTGKSFLSTNVATAIAAFGVNNSKGKKPRVALIEADLQNLSVGTLLQIEDDKLNLKSAMEKISTIIGKDGSLKGSEEDMNKVNEYVQSCFKPYKQLKNLEALVGSQLGFEETENIKGEYYTYLIESIIDDYDVIIVDSNSSLTHVNTYPILHMSKNCYYVLNLDFNNVRNNVRYKTILSEMGISDKIKYVLNEDIVRDTKHLSDGEEYEDLIYTSEHLSDSDFKLEARIPEIPKTVFLNRLYEGNPIVLDDKNYTLKARYEILKVANQIWPIRDFEKIENNMKKREEKKRKSFF